MTETERMLTLNYPEQQVANGYYTAKLTPDVGITVANMTKQTFVQFFPWHTPGVEEGTLAKCSGHERYANFIMSKASQDMAAANNLFTHWPFIAINDTNDILMIKCLIENARIEMEQYNANDRSSAPDAAAGEAVE